jgi:hypothetical protein
MRRLLLLTSAAALATGLLLGHDRSQPPRAETLHFIESTRAADLGAWVRLRPVPTLAAAPRKTKKATRSEPTLSPGPLLSTPATAAQPQPSAPTPEPHPATPTPEPQSASRPEEGPAKTLAP